MEIPALIRAQMVCQKIKGPFTMPWRERRDSIKDSFRGLQECIPTLRGDKTSRAQVLKKTGDYIVHMQKKISNHQDEIKELKNQDTQLEAQIRALEKAKASG